MLNIISITYALCSLICTILMGKGKYYSFIFGLLASILYSYITYFNQFFGSLALNLIYYIPIQIASLILWFKNTDKSKKCVTKTNLKLKEFMILTGVFSIISIFTIPALDFIHDKSPVLDSIILIFSILGAYLSAKRAVEQWIVWFVVDFCACLMWFKFTFNNKSAVAPCILWFFYCILAVIFYLEWKKELK